jgi:hypothetical protein
MRVSSEEPDRKHDPRDRKRSGCQKPKILPAARQTALGDVSDQSRQQGAHSRRHRG